MHGFASGALLAGFSTNGSLCLESLAAYGHKLLAGPTPLDPDRSTVRRAGVSRRRCG
eukprot:SAG22_NODE_1371_length_4582_cov_3.882222_4_plen_57_part_00